MTSCDECDATIDDTAIHNVSLEEPTINENMHKLEKVSVEHKYEQESGEGHTKLCGRCLAEYEYYESDGLT